MTALDSKTAHQQLENLRSIAVLIRESVKDDPELQTRLIAVVSLVTEHVATTEQNMTGPNDVDTVTSHLLTAQDVATTAPSTRTSPLDRAAPTPPPRSAH